MESKGIVSKIYRLISDIAFRRWRTDFGQNGFLSITDTSAHLGNFVAIKAEGSADAVIATGVTTYGDDLSAYTLNKGDVVYGPFTSITLTSGKVLAYYHDKID